MNKKIEEVSIVTNNNLEQFIIISNIILFNSFWIVESNF